MVLLQTRDLQRVMGQLEINAKEAVHTSIFVSGWRPFRLVLRHRVPVGSRGSKRLCLRGADQGMA